MIAPHDVSISKCPWQFTFLQQCGAFIYSVRRIAMKKLIVRSKQPIEGMARIGYLPKHGSVEVYVWTNDPGSVPHMHVRAIGGKKYEWECCIRYDSAEYFDHGKYHDRLPSRIGKELDKMLRSTDPDSFGNTYWQTALTEWNRNNSDVKLPLDLEQPDYSAL